MEPSNTTLVQGERIEYDYFIIKNKKWLKVVY
jgi:hypothetical protein